MGGDQCVFLEDAKRIWTCCDLLWCNLQAIIIIIISIEPLILQRLRIMFKLGCVCSCLCCLQLLLFHEKLTTQLGGNL